MTLQDAIAEGYKIYVHDTRPASLGTTVRLAKPMQYRPDTDEDFARKVEQWRNNRRIPIALDQCVQVTIQDSEELALYHELQRINRQDLQGYTDQMRF